MGWASRARKNQLAGMDAQPHEVIFFRKLAKGMGKPNLELTPQLLNTVRQIIQKAIEEHEKKGFEFMGFDDSGGASFRATGRVKVKGKTVTIETEEPHL
ncbi:MAG: hypothetical protein K1Y36_30680 [Blastocatellia bacterium]|nr:hypothetical protein [Blastocatellia bacterium]